MEITINNKSSNIKDLICFNTCPVIVSVDNSEGVTSSKASITLNVQSLSATDNSKPSRIIINGNAIQGTTDKTKVNGRRFYLTGGQYCALSIVNALKCIPQLVMNYDIVYNMGSSTLTITAKNVGSMYNIDIDTENLTGFSTNTSVNGSTSDTLVGSIESKVYLDLYYNGDENQRKLKSTSSGANYKYLTTLQKEYYKDSVSFNLSPALQSVSSSNNTTLWKARLYALVDGTIKDIGTSDNNYIINGYLVNQGGTYLDLSSWDGSKTYPAINVSRGKDRTQYNNSLIYIYNNIFPISLYKMNNTTKESITISYLEADESVITSTTTSITLNTTSNIGTYDIELSETYMRDSYYIDLQFSFGIIRLNVINPPYANAECNRVSWYNSYGGVSYFDFLGDKRDERKTDVTTYNKSLLDFYKNDKQEQAVVYFRENEITVSLTSHLIEEDGLYQLYDLQNSYKSWITINGVNYYIIITSLTVEEPSDNIYTATIKYKYSLLDSFA